MRTRHSGCVLNYTLLIKREKEIEINRESTIKLAQRLSVCERACVCVCVCVYMCVRVCDFHKTPVQSCAFERNRRKIEDKILK